VNRPLGRLTNEDKYGEMPFTFLETEAVCMQQAFFSYPRKPFSLTKKPCYGAASKEGWRQKSEYAVTYKISL
jgi:hypothetical protein